MRKKSSLFCMIMLCLSMLTILTSCSKEKKVESSDSYVFGQDYQYMFYNFDTYNFDLIEGEWGYYLVHSNFIYIIDKQTMKMAPLCNKPNCLHDKETDSNKLLQCNAYLNPGDTFITFQLQYYNGSIYYLNTIMNVENSTMHYELYKLSADGSTRDKVLTLTNVKIGAWSIHRGVFYYSTEEFDKKSDCIDTSDQTLISKVATYEIELGRAQEDETLIYRTDRKVEGMAQPFLIAYGNHLYIQDFGNDLTKVDAFNSGGSETTPLYWRIIQYNIKAKETTEISISEDSIVDDICLFKDKLIYDSWYYMQPDNYNGSYFISDLEGKSASRLPINTRSLESFYSDGQYLYLDNFRLADTTNEELCTDKEQKIIVYDKEYKEVDSFVFPVESIARVIPGDDTYMFYIVNNEHSLQLYSIKKAQFGSLKGQEVTPDLICTMINE